MGVGDRAPIGIGNRRTIVTLILLGIGNRGKGEGAGKTSFEDYVGL